MLLDQYDFKLHDRNNIIKMHSLIYNQLQAPIFEPMIRYSWYVCGYVTERAGKFLNANEILFDFSITTCDVSFCQNGSFIKCSHCREVLCFHCFFIAFHTHF
jgi:hypothetical protein